MPDLMQVVRQESCILTAQTDHAAILHSARREKEIHLQKIISEDVFSSTAQK